MEFTLGRRKTDHDHIYIPKLGNPNMRRTNASIKIGDKNCPVYGEVTDRGDWTGRFYAYEYGDDGTLIGHRVYKSKHC